MKVDIKYIKERLHDYSKYKYAKTCALNYLIYKGCGCETCNLRVKDIFICTKSLVLE